MTIETPSQGVRTWKQGTFITALKQAGKGKNNFRTERYASSHCCGYYRRGILFCCSKNLNYPSIMGL